MNWDPLHHTRELYCLTRHYKLEERWLIDTTNCEEEYNAKFRLSVGLSEKLHFLPVGWSIVAASNSYIRSCTRKFVSQVKANWSHWKSSLGPLSDNATRPTATRRIKIACLQSSKPAGHELIKVGTKLHLCFYPEVWIMHLNDHPNSNSSLCRRMLTYQPLQLISKTSFWNHLHHDGVLLFEWASFRVT